MSMRHSSELENPKMSRAEMQSGGFLPFSALDLPGTTLDDLKRGYSKFKLGQATFWQGRAWRGCVKWETEEVWFWGC